MPTRREALALTAGAAFAATIPWGPASAAPAGQGLAGTGYIDLRRYGGPDVVECDVCIAGAGAAGITLARRLAHRGRRVVVLESGGFDLDPDVQSLYEGEITGLPYFDLMSCRLRLFGGTTNHWGGFVGVPEPVDFEARPAIGLPGWPLRYEDVAPYFARALQGKTIESHRLAPAERARHAGFDPDELADAAHPDLQLRTFDQTPKSERNYRVRFEREVGRLVNTSVFLHANLTHIQVNPEGTAVDHFLAKSLDGRMLRVRPKVGVLACHAIENARLMLASNDVIAPGLGNASGELGRNFMEHVHITHGTFTPNEGIDLSAYYRDSFMPDRQGSPGFRLAFRGDVLRREGITQYHSGLRPIFADNEERAVQALNRLKQGFFQPFRPWMAQEGLTLASDPRATLAGLLSRGGVRGRKAVAFAVNHRIEQAPNASSRITLLPERDALGVPKVSLHWALNDLDIHTFARGQAVMRDALATLGWGRLDAEPITREIVEREVLGHWHHMGTTRMSASAHQGVVDPQCRVHGLSNLFVAGSGVFPSATSVGPTLFIVALAHRIADHIDSTWPAA